MKRTVHSAGGAGDAKSKELESRFLHDQLKNKPGREEGRVPGTHTQCE